MPGMDDIMRQNPDLMRQFQSAAVNTMAGSNPGFSGFMSGIMNPEPSPSQGRGPPAPMATQNAPRSSFANRPDMSMARSAAGDDGISIRESNFGVPGFQPPAPAQKSQRRADMKGPGDIDDILSGLKTKTINIAESRPVVKQQQQQESYPDNNSSTISINDLQDLQSDANVPKRSKRKPKSDKNTVSLDI